MKLNFVLIGCAAALSIVMTGPFSSAQTQGSDMQSEAYQVEEEGEQLAPLTVIATRTLKKPIDTPASVSVITENELHAVNAAHPFKVLALTEGIWPRQYRGMADYWGRPVIRGQRALVMVDGVNWQDYGYYFDTGAIPMPDVERIDVVRGSFSALYGSLAQTGVINYTTKIPESFSADASISYGDWNTRYASVRFADRPFARNEDQTEPSPMGGFLDDRFFYSLSFKSRTTDGYVTTPTYTSLSETVAQDEMDPDIPVVTGGKKDIDPQSGDERYKIGHQGKNWYEDTGLFFKTGYDFGPDTRLWYSFNISEFKYGWKDGRSDLNDASGTAVYDGDVYLQDGAATYLVSLDELMFTADPKEKKSMIHTVSFKRSVDNALDLNGLVAFNDKETTSHQLSEGQKKVEDNSLLQADLAATVHTFSDQFLITVGIQGIEENAKVTTDDLSDPLDVDSATTLYEETSGKNQTLGSFVQFEYTPIDPLTAYLGGRYDHWWGTDADYKNNAGENIDYPDADDGQFSPKASLVYRLMENGALKASYGQSFTAPSLYYRTASYYWRGGDGISIADPNPDLGPTTNTSWEIGTEWELWDNRIRVKATYFENDFEDLVVNRSTTYTNDEGIEVTQKERVNAESAEVNGIEASVEGQLPMSMKAGLFYAHNWSEYTQTDDEEKEGWELDETPTDMWSAWLGYFGDLADASLTYRYCDSRYDDDYAPYADTVYKGDDEYHLLDAKVSVRPKEHVEVSLSVENLLDEDYYEYYKGPGRFWLASVDVHF